MVATGKEEFQEEKSATSFDRMSELKAFDDSKTGVQGLIENGITKVPPIFHTKDYQISCMSSSEPNSEFSIPIIDLNNGVIGDDVVEKVKDACENWGFFQIINHGIPIHVLDDMVNGTRMFHEQDPEVSKQYYTRDLTKKVIYLSNFTLFQDPVADWRDTLRISMAPNPPKAEELPLVCRDIVMEYSEKVMELGSTLFELLSEALGLNNSQLKDIGCAEGFNLLCHSYPACPQPELTIGSSSHTDRSFMTILLQDHIGGLQVLRHHRWIDVPPIHGALVVNIGDLLQLVSNDNFISVQHKVLANIVGPRISVASLFRPRVEPGEATPKVFGPIKQLLSEENPPLYRETSLNDYQKYGYEKGLIRTCSISHLKL